MLELLIESNYDVVGVFTIPDKGNREDSLAKAAKLHKIPVFKFPLWRRKGVVLPDVLDQYKSVNANLNVLPFCSQFIPMEVIDGASYGSICYHPSILPRHRGASAISWTFIDGDDIAGFSIFWADDGLDTGPILLTKQCTVESNDTLDSIYKRFLYPEGVKSLKYAVDLIANGKAPKIPQIEFGATYDPPMFKEENQIINLAQPALRIFNFIRGLDSVPGALAYVVADNGDEEIIRLFGASLYHDTIPKNAKTVNLKGSTRPALINEHGLLIPGTDGNFVSISKVMRNGRMIEAKDWFNKTSERVEIVLTDAEKPIETQLKAIWQSILNTEIELQTNFLTSGAGSMDVVRLVEEVKDTFEIHLENSVVFMSPVFSEFLTEVVLAKRSNVSDNNHAKVEYKGTEINANKRQINVPTQLFIDGSFTDGEHVKKLDIINPATEEVICQVPIATSNDVANAVNAAHTAFNGSWNELSARQRGQLMYKLADLMEKHKEELATIESVDSGAVYTLALKTHVGMSIDAWRYFAGCTDKIEGKTIPVSAARPNNVLTYTKREPIG